MNMTHHEGDETKNKKREDKLRMNIRKELGYALKPKLLLTLNVSASRTCMRQTGVSA